MARAILAFLLPLLLGKAFEKYLATDSGAKLAVKLGEPALASEEGRSMVRKYAAAAATAAVGVVYSLQQREARYPGRNKSEAIGSFAELLLAGGALAKVVSDYLAEKQLLAVRRPHHHL